MTQRQISIVKSSWKIFRNIDPDLVGEVFYQKLFMDMPQARSFFKNDKSEQSKKLIFMIGVIVSKLDNLQDVRDDVRDFAIKLIKADTKQTYIKHVEDSLLWTLEQGLGKDWNNEMKEAWASGYQLFCDAMMIAAKEYESA